MAAAASSVRTLVQYSLGTPDERTPWVPDDAYFQETIHESIDKRRPYPSPYPKNHKPSIHCGTNYDGSSPKGPVKCSGSIIHAADTTRLVAATYINISEGSIIVGDNVLLKAPVVRIHDDGKCAIRTSIIARKSLQIEADILIINRADIFAPEEISLKVKDFEFLNSTPNTAIFIESLAIHDTDAAAQPNVAAVDSKAGDAPT